MKTEKLVAFLMLIGIVMFLSGCANLKFAWSASYQTENLAADLKAMEAEREAPVARPAISYAIAK